MLILFSRPTVNLSDELNPTIQYYCDFEYLIEKSIKYYLRENLFLSKTSDEFKANEFTAISNFTTYFFFLQLD